MLFHSLGFLLFFPAVCLVYFALPARWRQGWLLFGCLLFSLSWGAACTVVLAAVTAVSYGAARGMAAAKGPKARRAFFATGLAGCLAFLLAFKYLAFLLDTAGALLGAAGLWAGVPAVSLLQPAGISFYTLRAVGYLCEVYRGREPAEPRPLRYALYVAFFPCLTAGPIQRSGEFLPQLDAPRPFDAARVRDGLLLMLWGFFEKLVIADRAAIVVDTVFADYAVYGGVERFLAAVLFAVQLYCDFGGYSHIAIGAAQVLGFAVKENFRQPYFALSIGEFWARWHISLSSWLRDYIYIPLGGNRGGAAKKYRNLLVTFLVSGLWHGAAWHYVAWGALHAVYQILADAWGRFGPKRPKPALHFGARWGRRLCTFLLADAAWVVFRADSTADAVHYLAGMLGWRNYWAFTDGTLLRLGLDGWGWFVLFCAVLVLFAVDLCHEHGVRLRAGYARQGVVCRWLVCYAALFAVIILGVWGPGYSAADFIYSRF